MKAWKRYLLFMMVATALVQVVLYSSRSFLLFFSLSSAQIAKETTDKLPVILIHGYLSDASVWKNWEEFLKEDGIEFETVTFKKSDDKYDKCGTTSDHAKELGSIVEDFKRKTGAGQINIVGHSKGGLDARVYLSNITISDSNVANLIMIGTPNAGSPRAENRDLEVINNANKICSPFPDQAINDLIPGAAATEVKKNDHTQYHTIAGDWKAIFDGGMFISTLIPTPPFGILVWTLVWTLIDNDCIDDVAIVTYQFDGSIEIDGPDDGIVPLESIESGEFNSIGHTDNCHTNLFSDEEFDKAMTILDI